MKILSEKGRAAVVGTLVLAYLSGCGPVASDTEGTPPGDDPAQGNTPPNQPDRGGIGMTLPLPPPPPPPGQQPPPPPPPGPTTGGVDPQRSLVVTDAAILNKFSFVAVMDQLVGTSGAQTTALNFFQQWWDTQRPGPGLGLGPHCDSPGIANMNGFQYTCPPAAGNQKSGTPNVLKNASRAPKVMRLPRRGSPVSRWRT